MEATFAAHESQRSWPMLFSQIKNRSSQDENSIKEARKPENKTLNRYRDVSPYDHSRIVLSRTQNDYINASEVQVEAAGRRYILTQGPLPATVDHFWLMVWEQNTKGIVMLNRLVEKNFVKCHQYWPATVADEMAFDDLELKVALVAESCNESTVCRTLKLSDLKSGESREILQFHYTNWPDFGVPSSPQNFLDFLDCVRKSGCLENNIGPAIVHCSAGIGRSGSFCLVDSILKIVEEGVRKESEIVIEEILQEMRTYRMSLIQTAEQLRFSYLAIIEAIRRFHNDPPYSLEHVKDVNAPPPPPHRSLRRHGFLKQPIEPDEESDDKDGKIRSESSSGDSSNTSDEEDDEDSEPPPLPPNDIPVDTAYEIHENGQHKRLSPTPPMVKLVEKELDSFERKILASETMRPAADPPVALTQEKKSGEENMESEILVRKRERNRKISEQIQTIKKGIHDSDAAHDKQALFDKIGVGIVLFLGAGFVFYRIIDYIRS